MKIEILGKYNESINIALKISEIILTNYGMG